jgi:hypothetical protein
VVRWCWARKRKWRTKVVRWCWARKESGLGKVVLRV